MVVQRSLYTPTHLLLFLSTTPSPTNYFYLSQYRITNGLHIYCDTKLHISTLQYLSFRFNCQGKDLFSFRKYRIVLECVPNSVQRNVDQNLKPLAVIVYGFTTQPVVPFPGSSLLWVTSPKKWSILCVFKEKMGAVRKISHLTGVL